jgi:hypothetical protein
MSRRALMQVNIARNQAMSLPPFRLLILEDTVTDAELEQLMLRGAGLTFTARVVAIGYRALVALRPLVSPKLKLRKGRLFW